MKRFQRLKNRRIEALIHQETEPHADPEEEERTEESYEPGEETMDEGEAVDGRATEENIDQEVDEHEQMFQAQEAAMEPVSSLLMIPETEAIVEQGTQTEGTKMVPRKMMKMRVK